ncbi:MAG: S8 family serine peptidase [Acidobacteriota bacterium]
MSKSKTYSIFQLLFLLTFFGTAYSQELVSGEDFVPSEVLVKFKPDTPLSTINAINEQIGATIIGTFRGDPDLYQIELPPNISVEAAIDFYERQPSVERAQPNFLYRPDFVPNDTRFDELWGLHNTGQTGGTNDVDIDAPAAWDESVGSTSEVIAITDTGVDYNHEDLSAKHVDEPLTKSPATEWMTMETASMMISGAGISSTKITILWMTLVDQVQVTGHMLLELPLLLEIMVWESQV